MLQHQKQGVSGYGDEQQGQSNSHHHDFTHRDLEQQAVGLGILRTKTDERSTGVLLDLNN